MVKDFYLDIGDFDTCLLNFIVNNFTRKERTVLKNIPAWVKYINVLEYKFIRSQEFYVSDKDIQFFKHLVSKKLHRYDKKSSFTLLKPELYNKIKLKLQERRIRQEALKTADFEGSSVQSKIIFHNSRPKEILVRQGKAPSLVFIDQLTFVVKVNSFFDVLCEDNLFEWSSRKDKKYNRKFFQDADGEEWQFDEVVKFFFSKYLVPIFGFDNFYSRDRGINGYSTSYAIGNPESGVNYGFIGIGGNKGTICVSLTATGLGVAKEGWEQALYLFAFRMGDSFHITRLDLARDFFEGEYNIEQAEKSYLNGNFSLSNRRPLCDKHGLDWFNEDTKKGKTFYIGSRKYSSRFIRIYEKGKQLGDENSDWVRVEVEYRRRDFVIPLDMLLYPTDYFCEYPALRDLLFHLKPAKKMELRKQVKKLTMDLEVQRLTKFFRNQIGKFINYLIFKNYSPERIIKLLQYSGNPFAFPKRLNLENFFVIKKEYYT